MVKPVARIVQHVRSVSPLVADSALAAVLAVPLLVDFARRELPPDGPFRPADAVGYVLVAMLIAPLALRRQYPVAVFAVILVDATIVATMMYAPSSFGFGLIVATYTVAAHTPRPTSWAALWLAQAFVFAAKIRAVAAGIDINWFDWPLDAVYVGGAWYLGDTIQTRRRYADQLERNREELARHAVLEERTNLARELHDAVGHAMSVIVIHAGAGEKHLEPGPSRARTAFQAISQVGKEALHEMDRLLGVLRADDPDGNWLVRPSLANLSHLTDEFRALGLEVTTTVQGSATKLGSGVDQAAFRIIQEALTNTLKHAGPTDAEVTLRYGSDELCIEVRDHGRGRAPLTNRSTDHHSRGLTGMRERVEVQHGSLDVGPCRDGGYRVLARIPTTSATSS